MIRCALIQNLLTAAILAGEEPGWPIRSHVGHCIKCQAHAASLRATRRRLSELGHEQLTPPAGFEIQVMDGLESPIQPVSSNIRWARAAGASMAAALLAAVWMRRRALARA